MTKTLLNRLYLKAKFFTFNMQEGQKLNNHIDKFNKLCLDLENIDINYDEEDKALVLLHSLPRTYETFVDILKHGREKLSLEDVFGALNSTELQQKLEGIGSAGDVLTARSRTENREFKSKGKSRSKSRNNRKLIKCFHCHEKGHFKRNYPNRKKESQERTSPECSNTMCGFGYESVDAL